MWCRFLYPYRFWREQWPTYLQLYSIISSSQQSVYKRQEITWFYSQCGFPSWVGGSNKRKDGQWEAWSSQVHGPSQYIQSVHLYLNSRQVNSHSNYILNSYFMLHAKFNCYSMVFVRVNWFSFVLMASIPQVLLYLEEQHLECILFCGKMWDLFR